MSSLLAPLLQRRRDTGQAVFARFVGEGGERALAWEELFAHACRFAAFLQARGVEPRETVFVLAPLGPDVLSGFLGAILAGAIPALLSYPSAKVAPEVYSRNLVGVLGLTGARTVLTTRALEPSLRSALTAAPAGRRFLWIEDARPLAATAQEEWERAAASIRPDEVAFLQHSSGSTGLQKGVALSHTAVLAHLGHYARALELDPARDKVASWLPLYHDMGLIATFLLPLVTGTPVVFLDPFRWVVDPALLLEAIDRHRATLCWLPNFAYAHLVRRVPRERSERLDLSCMRAFINCSEPVREGAHRAFLARFAANGVQERMLWVCYAMAENTFAVTQAGGARPGGVDRVDPRALATEGRAVPLASGVPIVSCGLPIEGCEVRVVDEGRQPVEERRVGEVALRSDSMLSEYHQNPAATAAALANGVHHTGDLGYLADGQLYITGRKKDLIIVGGRNFHPQDIEDIAGEQEGVLPGRAAALGVDDPELGTQGVVVVAETTLTDPAVLTALRRAVQRAVLERLDCAVSRVELVEPGWIIKTSSGKVARGANLDKLQGLRAEARAAVSAAPGVPVQTVESGWSLAARVLFTVLVLVLAEVLKPNHILILYRGF